MNNGAITHVVQNEGWEYSHITFALPDGQQVDVQVRLHKPGELSRKRWEVCAWHIADEAVDAMGQKMATFEFPLDTSIYPT